MSRRFLGTSAIIVGGGVGYYLYSAGGDPKVAQKMAEHDASAATNKVKNDLPGSGKEAKKQGEEWSARAGKGIDDAVADAKSKGKEVDAKLGKEWNKAEGKFNELKSEAGSKFDELRKDTNKSIDSFDKTVEKKTSEAKSGVSSWFGGSK